MDRWLKLPEKKTRLPPVTDKRKADKEYDSAKRVRCFQASRRMNQRRRTRVKRWQWKQRQNPPWADATQPKQGSVGKACNQVPDGACVSQARPTLHGLRVAVLLGRDFAHHIAEVTH